MASYTYKPQDEISSKAQKTRVQANLRNDLKRVQEEYEQEGRFNEAINQYKFIFSEAMGKDLQNIASDAEALKVKSFTIFKNADKDMIQLSLSKRCAIIFFEM